MSNRHRAGAIVGVGELLDAVTDLVLGSRCVGCERPGRLLCGRCRSTLPASAEPTWPSPPPAGLVTPFAASAYAGLVQQLVLGHKEHRMLVLAGPLADLLAVSVTEALASAGADGPAVLVPVPSRPRACAPAVTTRRTR